MGGGRSETPGSNQDFSFVSPVVKYLLFVFNFLFWVSVLKTMSDTQTFPICCVLDDHLFFMLNQISSVHVHSNKLGV